MNFLESTFQPNPAVSARKIEDEYLIYHPDVNELFTLNTIGQEIWEYLHQDLSVEKIIDQICLKFGSESDIVEPDVINFLVELLDNGFIQNSIDDKK